MIYIIEENLNLYEKLGVIIRSALHSSINGSDEMHICESLRLNHVCWIEDGPPRFHCIAREEEMHETSFV